MNHVPISFIVPVYNEAARIRLVLEHATRWADEVIIADKGSTDGTLDICHSYGNKVRIQSIPFTKRGNEEMTLFPSYCQNEWIFLGTCSEVPTSKLINSCRSILDSKGDRLDLVLVPRHMYAFGLHCNNPDWGVCHYPFLFHRTRTRIVNDVHDNFHATDPSRIHRIPYSEDCCVHHMTYPTAKSFWLASQQYFEAEVQKPVSPDKAIRQCFKNIDRMAQKVLLDNENWVPFYCAFASYELGKALSIWEKNRSPQLAADIYKHLGESLLTSEWLGQPRKPPVNSTGIFIRGLQPLAAFLAWLPYVLFKVTLLVSKARNLFRA